MSNKKEQKKKLLLTIETLTQQTKRLTGGGGGFIDRNTSQEFYFIFNRFLEAFKGYLTSED